MCFLELLDLRKHQTRQLIKLSENIAVRPLFYSVEEKKYITSTVNNERPTHLILNEMLLKITHALKLSKRFFSKHELQFKFAVYQSFLHADAKALTNYLLARSPKFPIILNIGQGSYESEST